MKKYILVTALLLALLLTACSSANKAEPITLPSSDEFISVSVIKNDVKIVYTDAEWMEEIASILVDMELTNIQSVNDFPNADDVQSVEITCIDETKNASFFVYERNGTYYAEKPYTGIYECAPALYTILSECKISDGIATSVIYDEVEYNISDLGSETVRWLDMSIDERTLSSYYPVELFEATELGDRIPMVMLNGLLYLDTGHKSTIEARCGVMDGEITSTVDGSQIPTEDNQSNFGTGYGWQYGIDEGTVEIYMNEAWWVFATEAVHENLQFGEQTNP